VLVLVEWASWFGMTAHLLSAQGTAVVLDQPSPRALHVKGVLSAATQTLHLRVLDRVKTNRTKNLLH
jgi:hypothetical protein